nr:MAG TPA: Metal binding domain of Ada [Caudoviricetes sp.]
MGYFGLKPCKKCSMFSFQWLLHTQYQQLTI